MSRPNDVRSNGSKRTSSACYYSNKSTAIRVGAQAAAEISRESTKQRRCSVKFAREPLKLAQGGGRTAGQHRRCVPARRLMTARTKPGRQSECAASWLDRDGNSCCRGCCFLVRTWRAVPVGRSYRRAPLPTHKSCPIPPTLLTVLFAHVSRRSFANLRSRYRCAVFLSNQHTAGLLQHEHSKRQS